MSLFEDYQKSRGAVNGQTPTTGGNSPAPTGGNAPVPTGTGSLYAEFQKQRTTLNTPVTEKTDPKIDSEVGKILDSTAKDNLFSLSKVSLVSMLNDKNEIRQNNGTGIPMETFGEKTKNLLKKILPKSVEDIFGLNKPKEEKLTIEEWGDLSMSHERLKELDATVQDVVLKKFPDGVVKKPKDYKEPGFFGQIKEGFIESYLSSLKPTIGTMLETARMSPESVAFGKKQADRALAELITRPDLNPPEDMADFFKGGFKDKRWWGRAIGSAVPSIATALAGSIAGGLVGGPAGAVAGGFGASYLLEKNGAYQDMIQKGVAPDKAILASDGYAIIAATIEQFFGVKPGEVAMNIISGSVKKFTKNEIINVPISILKKAIGEADEEAIQQLTQNLITKYVYSEQGLTEGVAESWAQGIVGGFGFGAIDVTSQARRKKEEVNNDGVVNEPTVPIEKKEEFERQLKQETVDAVKTVGEEETKTQLVENFGMEETQAETFMEEALKQWTEPAGDETMAEIKAAEEAVDAWDAKVEEVKAKNEKPAETKTQEVSNDVQNILEQMEDDPAVQADWEDNYAEQVGELADQVSNLEKQAKTAKGEQKTAITKAITTLNSQIDRINTEFSDKYENIAKEKANEKIQAEVTKVNKKTSKKEVAGQQNETLNTEGTNKEILDYYFRNYGYPSLRGFEGMLNTSVDESRHQDLIEQYKKDYPDKVVSELDKESKEAKKSKTDFEVGDILDTQGNTNMADPITVTEIKGNTLKFTDANGVEYGGMSKSTVRNVLRNESWKSLDKENEGVDNKEYGRDTKNIGGDIQSGTDTGGGETGTEGLASAGKPSAKRGKRVARGQSDTSSDGARERSEQDLIEEVAQDSIEKQKATGYSNEAIQALVEAKTTINERGEVIITGEISDRELEITNSYTPAGGKEKQGAEGRGLLDEYYTPSDVVDMTARLLGGLGVLNDDMRVLEPSAGIGAFLASVPFTASIDALEINDVTARIAKLNNPQAKVFNTPFESVFVDKRGEKKNAIPNYDLVVGNPPYGDHRGKYKGMGEEPNIARYEEYFIKRALDVTNEGGHVAMVVPSGFLRSPSNQAKRSINEIAELVVAYRLPNGAFPTTDIGTDIVVFKKNTKKSAEAKILNVQTISDDYYFRDVMNREKILGENTTRKGRFGIEPFVKGDLAGAMEMFYKALGQDYAETVTSDPEVELGIEEELQTTYKPEVYKETHTKEEVKQETTTEEKIEAKEKKKADAKNKKAVIETSKKAKGRLDLSTFSTATKEDADLWQYVKPTGELDGDFDTTKTFYNAGRYYNKFNYLQGDIYDKLDQLEKDKNMISAEQYAMQKKALEDVKPEIVTVDRMSVSPNAKFVADLKLGEHSLADKFMQWVKDLPRTALGSSSTWAIRGYVENQAVRGGDKLQNEQERRTRRTEADRLFKLYIKDELNAEQQKIVEDAYNRQFNAYVRPNYRNVPLTTKLHDSFNGKPLDIREVQLQGVGFLVNRGVGLLAHDVGVGKTMQAIIANAEMLKRGWAKKPLIVVPSVSVYNQWVKEIQELIPDVTINLLENLGGDFKGDLKTLEIKEGTLSIITDEGFKRLGFKDETYNELTKDFYDVIANPDPKATKRSEAGEELKAEETIGKGIRGTRFDRYFEDLGFDLITADECHNYNHIVSRAKMDKGQVSEFRGFQVQPSLAGIKMWLATQYILKNNNGRNVFLLSATPFTNNPLEYYSILSLMARERMQRMGLTNVNDFMTMFMEISSKAEFKADGQYVEKSEVRGFKNYQQFQKLLTEFIDFRDGVEAGVKRPIREAREYVVGETKEAFDYKTLAQDLFKDTKHAGALKAINELRAVAFSPYLSRYYEGAIPTATQLIDNSPKIKATIELIKQTLKDNPVGGHLIYSTVGVEYFPLIKEYLEKNVNLKGKVEIISGMTPKNKRAGIQEDFNSGKIKVIIGSDAIQEGVNLQKNTTDLYILSLPWNFTSLRQVIGRAWRQGNKWPKLRVNNVFTENSIDTFLSQKLQNKETRYEESLKFKGDTLDVGDIDFEALKFDLITDPVTRTELEYKFKQQELETDMKRKESDFAYKNRRAKELIEAREQVTRYEEYLKDEEKPEDSWAFKRVQDAKKDLAEVEARLKDKGLNIAEISKDIEKADKEMADIKARIENLNIEKEDAMKKALDQRTEAFGVPKETDYKQFVSEREEDNQTFFNGGPGYETNYTTIPKAKRASLASQAIDKLLGNKPAFLKADLSTTILEDLKNKVVVSKQYILDSVKREGVKKAEKEVMLEALAEMPEGADINVEMFGSKVVGKLLELTRDYRSDSDNVDYMDVPFPSEDTNNTRYSFISLPEQLKGDLIDYSENIYESPIMNGAGAVHFANNSGKSETSPEKYFAHTRVEDMADEKTRRVIELQSDLFQKGRLESESAMSADNIQEYGVGGVSQRKADLAKLEPYRNTWHERIIREEIKQAAKDGKTTLLFPTGETAMLIEGLGNDEITWVINDETPDNEGDFPNLETETMSIGLNVIDNRTGDEWLITEVMENGKFKAVPKIKVVSPENHKFMAFAENMPAFPSGERYMERDVETFDISGKVDETNPIYQFYEKEVYKYLRKIRPDLQRITDARGVSWFETKVTESDFNQPVLAFKKPLFSKLEGPKITIEEAKKLIFAEIPEKDIRIIFNPDLVKEKGILGEYRDAINPALKPVIELYTEGNYTSATTAYHEAGHYIFNNIVETADKENVIKIAREDMSLITKGKYRIAGYASNEVAEEYVMDEYANYKVEKAGYVSRMTWFFKKLDEIFKGIIEKAKLIKARIDQFIDERGGPEGGFIRPFMKKSDIEEFDLSNKQAERDRTKQEDLENITKELSVDEDSQNKLRKDINSVESLTAQARDLYLKDPNEFEAAKTYEKIGDARRMKKTVLDNKYSKILKPYFTLVKNSQEKVNKILMSGDETAKEYSVDDLQQLNLNADEIKAYQSVRRAFNIAHELLLNEMAKNGVNPEEIDQFKQERIGYMPHKWKYKFAIKTKAVDSKGKWVTETMDTYKTKREAQRVFDEKVKGNKAPGIVKYELDTLDSLEVDFFSEQKLSFEAMKSVIAQAKTSDDIKKNMIDALRNMVKEKGFGRNYIKRTGVRGYEASELPKIMADYFAGLNGFVTKMEAGKQYYDILSTIDARRQSKFYEWIRDAIAYDMGNQNESISGKIPFTNVRIDLKQVAFIYYLANDLSFLLTNATQNWVIGAGELSKYMTGKQKIVGPEVALAKATFDWALKRVTKEERAVIDGLVSIGELGGEMASELMGFKNNPMYTQISSWFSKAMYASTALVEKNVNRIPAFLAARRTLMEQGMDEKSANEKALDISNDIHFRYGKQNRPEFMRGKKGVFFVFNHYIRSLMYQLYRDLSRREFTAFTKKMLGTVILGGAKALPFASLLVIIFRKFYHDDDDDEGEEEMKKWQIAIERGIPAVFGIDLSSRVGIELMSINSIVEDPANIKSYIGAAGNLFWLDYNPEEGGRLQRGFELLKQGRVDDAFAQLLPDFAGNPLKAYAGYNWGVRSFAGTPLETDDGDVFKYNAWEAIVKGAGFTPTRESILWDEKSKQWAKMDLVTAEQATVRRTIIGQIQRGDMVGARQTQLEAVGAGTISADTDYILKYGKETFVADAYKQWEASAKTGTDRKRIQKNLTEELYGMDATDAQKNNANRAFAIVRTFGENNKNAELIDSSGTNAEKVNNLRKLKGELSETDFADFMNKARKDITLESGKTSKLLVTDSVLEDFNKVKDIPYVENEGVYKDNEKTTATGIINKVVTYAEAIGTDPVTAFNRIFTGQIIRRVDNGAIIVERMPLSESASYKAELGATGEMRLDHTVPLELGGSNSKSNLKLVSVEDWASYTPVENYVAKLLRAEKISKNKARELIVNFKNKKITADDVYKIK